MEEKYFCRNCKGLRNHQEIFKLKTKGDEGYGSFQWVEDYSIIKCMGCETVSFLKMYGDTSMIESDIHGNPDYFYENIIYQLRKVFFKKNKFLVNAAQMCLTLRNFRTCH
jgi:hypothetical protein